MNRVITCNIKIRYIKKLIEKLMLQKLCQNQFT